MLKLKNRIKMLDFWNLASYFTLLLIIAPIFYILLNIFNSSSEQTSSLLDSSLNEYLINSSIIVFFTALFTTIIGVFLAYFESFYEFRFKKFFKFALVLPFAVPNYLFAYIYADFFSYSGWLVAWLRSEFGIKVHFDMMNIYGVIFIFTISFFPYVYIILRGFLAKFSVNLIESAKSLGKSDTYIFFKVILPLSRAAIVAGASLCVMESLNAFGTPNYYGVHVFSTGIYKAWVGYSDINAAIKLAGILLLIVFFFLFVERIFRKPTMMTTSKTRRQKLQKLSKKSEIIVIGAFFAVFFISFLFPMINLLVWINRSFESTNWAHVFDISQNTLLLTIFSTIFIIVISLFLTLVSRFQKGKAKLLSNSLANIGYSVPGSVIAIGMLMIFIWCDKHLASVYGFLGIEKSLFLTLSPVILIFAYVIRFLSLGYNGIEAGLKACNKSCYEASLSLGYGRLATFFKVDFAMIKTSIYSAFILIFIEIIKELPLSSLLSPPNFRTLAFEIDRYASDEQLAMTAVPSLIIIVFCFVLLSLFYKIQKKDKI
ncbi:iron(III) ABC transporter, permease component [Campylobacter iguaniorum]|uniref:Putative iron ABC transporter, permease component n=2 Tax=Campylobacter iguaniorum TaxID=1244531 RepID=A0A076FC65_9BACT|nr:putative iron ABC transporter, permease component [Campylobacter iguaniorum]ALV25189.2 iron(III) ABC transporter, permease component [Campylobacter iguaniorum]